MKKTILITALFSFFLNSCSKDEDKPTLNDLQKVSFEQFDMPSKEVSSKKTGNIITIGNTTQFEYLTTVESSFTLQPIAPPNGAVNDVIYPGSILSGGDFIKGKYTPLRLSVNFKPVTLTTDLRGVTLGDPIQMNPSFSGFNKVINDLITNKNLKPELTPGDSDYTFEELTTGEKANKSLKIHADFNYLAVIKANFDFSREELTTNDERFVLISFRQKIFNASIDAQYKTSWIDGTIDPNECNGFEPLYISSVDYGRIAYLRIKTKESAQKITEIVKASVTAAFKVAGGGATVDSQKELSNYFKSNKIKVYAAGGTNAITDITTFNAFVTEPASSTKVGAAVPISYRVRRIRDNSDVDVVGVFRDDKLEYKTK